MPTFPFLCYDSPFSATPISQNYHTARATNSLRGSKHLVWFSKLCQAFPSSRSCTAGDFVLNILRVCFFLSFFLSCVEVLLSIVLLFGCYQAGRMLRCLVERVIATLWSTFCDHNLVFQAIVSLVGGVLAWWYLRSEETVPLVQHKNKNKKSLLFQRQLLHSNITPRKVLAAVFSYYSRMCSV